VHSPSLRKFATQLLLVLACAGYLSAQSFTPQDQSFLDDLQHRSVQYFLDDANPQTGLVPDRARVDGSSLDDNHRDVASTAATGFGQLSAIGSAAARRANVFETRSASSRTKHFINGGGFFIGLMGRPVSVVGTAKFHLSIQRCYWLVFSRSASTSATIRKSEN
jgi:hypothetical protein